MLAPVTESFEDRSTEEYFQFAFFCDACRFEWVSPRYNFISHFRKGQDVQSGAEAEARRMIWLCDHDSAYERANLEASRQFNRCTLCGKFVCDDCAVICDELDGSVVCIGCARERRLKGCIVGRTTEKRDMPVDFSHVTNLPRGKE